MRGTIYWAVSAITDGSVGEDDLIKPPAYGSIAVQTGTVIDLRAPVNDDGGLGGGLVHGQLGHGALGGPDLGAGGPVDHLLDAAGQIQLHGHVVLGPLLAPRGVTASSAGICTSPAAWAWAT